MLHAFALYILCFPFSLLERKVVIVPADDLVFLLLTRAGSLNMVFGENVQDHEWPDAVGAQGPFGGYGPTIVGGV